MLISLDEMIAQNQTIGNSLTLYKRMISKVMDDPETYGSDSTKAGKVQYLLQKIEGDILEQNIFIGCISRSFEDVTNKIEVQTNQLFQAEFRFNLKTIFDSITNAIDKPDECGKRSDLIGFTGLYILFERLFREDDKKFFWTVWTLSKKIPLIHIYGNTTFSFGEFLYNTTYFKTMLKNNSVKNPKKDVLDAKNATLKLLDENLSKKVKLYYAQICQWESRIESSFSVGEEGRDVLGIEGTLMMEGIFMAYSLSDLLKTITYLHIDTDKSLTVDDILNICKCIEMLKSIESSFNRKSGSIAQLMSFVTELLSYKIQKLLVPIKHKIEAKKKYTPQEYDQLSAIILSLEIISNPPSKKRILLLRLCLPIALSQSTTFLKDTSYEDIRSLVSKLEILSDFETLLKNATDCSFIYWSREIFEIYFKDIYKHPTRSQELCHVLSALQDCKPILKAAVHLKNDELFINYEKYIYELIEETITNPLCEEIEKELRLLIHTTVLGTEKEPMKLTKDLSSFFKIRPILFFENYIDFEKIVEFYLNKLFYDLTAITNSDWKSYEQMRNLAQSKFGLKLSNVYLPSQTLEQGLDILLITKNIHIFVSKYSYNLNTNGFIERGAFTDAKNLNSINISHVSNSIRTHGTGIMNTTVNFVYKFLGKKFYIFSQFLYDDHIKSRLIKDSRFYKENAAKLDNKYPFARAQKFIQDIKKLGLHEGKETYLGLFRNLIIEIGNALGYVRMVRAGGLRYISESIKYVPNLDHIEDFDDLVKEDNLSEESMNAAKNLKDSVNNMKKKFAEGSDYFKLLDKVLTTELNKEENHHLKNFYLIIPPLTISYIENMIIAKDKMVRSGKEANFTEDGFALGVAFILKILNQNSAFDSLHWFESVEKLYNEEYDKLQESMKSKKQKIEKKIEEADEHDNYMKLTLNKVKTFLTENELLLFSFSASRIFFKD